MFEFTVILFKKIFIAFGITHGRYAFSSKEFDISTHFHICAFKVSIYFYVDSTDGMSKRAMLAAMGSFKRHMDNQNAQEVPNSGVNYMTGRA